MSKETEITSDEFAYPEVGDEWVDRHGVDRSPDAEAKRIDDAYEKYRDNPEQLWPVNCKWCRMPNGKHHPDCIDGEDKGKTTLEILQRIQEDRRRDDKVKRNNAHQAKINKRLLEGAAEEFKQEYEMNFVGPAQKSAQEKLAETLDSEIAKAMGMTGGAVANSILGEPHIIPQAWKISASTEVFVSDNKGVLCGHRMKKDAVYGTEQVVGAEVVHPMRFVYPLTKSNEEISTTLADLLKAGFIVVETGLKRWPYIILEQKHAIVVYCSPEAFVGEYGGTCRKLGY